MFVLSWIVYGLFVGLVAKMFLRGPETTGILSTILIGIAGSYVGGFINWIMGMGMYPFESSGIIMGIIGGIIFIFIYQKYFKANNDT